MELKNGTNYLRILIFVNSRCDSELPMKVIAASRSAVLLCRLRGSIRADLVSFALNSPCDVHQQVAVFRTNGSLSSGNGDFLREIMDPFNLGPGINICFDR